MSNTLSDIDGIAYVGRAGDGVRTEFQLIGTGPDGKEIVRYRMVGEGSADGIDYAEEIHVALIAGETPERDAVSKASGALLSYWDAAIEAYDCHGPDGLADSENGDLFPLNVMEWGSAHTFDLFVARDRNEYVRDVY
ncbi:hypothetical protein ACIA8K_12715 [Catenuloplanes sp. NPDC051500]|uniref:hypothetical protein n=1 Tax=Catenuloplanes sp. NPDC051500 TaxID=3363959 RepID=UPI0037879383